MKQQTHISFNKAKRQKIVSISVQNDTFDSLQINPDDAYSYYLTPESEGPVIITCFLLTSSNGSQVLIKEQSKFEAIVPPVVVAKLRKNNSAKRNALRYELVDESTNLVLPKRYHGHFFDVEVQNEQREVTGILPMQSGTTIYLDPSSEAVKVRNGYKIRFRFPIRDLHTGVLFYSEEVESIL